MVNTKASKRRAISAVVAVAIAVLICLSGTFAWQSYNQTALNEVSATANPGGRLHDDFVDITYGTDGLADYDTMTYNKDVYVENFTSLASNGVQIYARVRLDEYMELGDGAGQLNDDGTLAASNKATSVVNGAKLEDKSTWTTYIYGDDSSVFRTYWNLDNDGGKTIYMPTFNKNKDSLIADINGTFKAGFADYTDYAGVTEKTDDDVAEVDGTAVYDADSNTTDELGASKDYNAFVDSKNITTTQETHQITPTLEAEVISMEQWIKDGSKQGNFWVYDVDGWAYWANPIDPQSATGLVLDGISRTDAIINEDWYYGINVVAQFITGDDIGYGEGTGFYDLEKGSEPSFNALLLLEKIGVDTTVEVSDRNSLQTALLSGSDVVIKGTINCDDKNIVAGDNQNAEIVMSEGGILSGGTIVADNFDTFAGLFVNCENDWPVPGDGANAASVENVVINAKSDNAISAQAIDNNITLNDLVVENISGNGILADKGDGTVTINNCLVTACANAEATDIKHTAIAAANGANVVISGGTYKGEYAAYVYGTGGTITINDGIFEGDLKADAGSIVIKGGKFSFDPTQFLADGYKVALADGVYTVTAE